MNTIVYILSCLTFLILLIIIYGYIQTVLKDREWRRNNPDEHEIMNRKIKDDFSKKE